MYLDIWCIFCGGCTHVRPGADWRMCPVPDQPLSPRADRPLCPGTDWHLSTGADRPLNPGTDLHLSTCADWPLGPDADWPLSPGTYWPLSPGADWLLNPVMHRYWRMMESIFDILIHYNIILLPSDSVGSWFKMFALVHAQFYTTDLKQDHKWINIAKKRF